MLDLIARPFGILMLWLYELTHNYLLAVVLFSLIVKLILTPFQMKSKKGMMRQTLLQPQLNEIAKKHGANKAKYNEEVQKLYQEEGVNPMSGCIWSLIPFPILIALYQAIRKPLTCMMGLSSDAISQITDKLTELGYTTTANSAYGEISQAKFISEHFSEFSGISDKLKNINYTSFGLDLGATPNWKFWTYDWSNPKLWGPALGLFMIPVLAAFFTWLPTQVQKKMTKKTAEAAAVETDETAAATNNAMMLFAPIMTIWFAFIMPAALGVYWIANSVFGMLQDIWLTRRYTKILSAENAERIAKRKEREAELEAKRQETERLKAMNATTQSENTSKRKQQIKKRQAQNEKALEWEKSQSGEDDKPEPSRVGHRKYARGRAYDPDRFSFNGVEGATENTSELDEQLQDVEDKLNAAALKDASTDIDSDVDIDAEESEELEAETSEDENVSDELSENDTTGEN
jgi:YidC/Oxa1 family membrane protein insertase